MKKIFIFMALFMFNVGALEFNKDIVQERADQAWKREEGLKKEQKESWDRLQTAERELNGHEDDTTLKKARDVAEIKFKEAVRKNAINEAIIQFESAPDEATKKTIENKYDALINENPKALDDAINKAKELLKTSGGFVSAPPTIKVATKAKIQELKNLNIQTLKDFVEGIRPQLQKASDTDKNTIIVKAREALLEHAKKIHEARTYLEDLRTPSMTNIDEIWVKDLENVIKGLEKDIDQSYFYLDQETFNIAKDQLSFFEKFYIKFKELVSKIFVDPFRSPAQRADVDEIIKFTQSSYSDINTLTKKAQQLSELLQEAAPEYSGKDSQIYGIEYAANSPQDKLRTIEGKVQKFLQSRAKDPQYKISPQDRDRLLEAKNNLNTWLVDAYDKNIDHIPEINDLMTGIVLKTERYVKDGNNSLFDQFRESVQNQLAELPGKPKDPTELYKALFTPEIIQQLNLETALFDWKNFDPSKITQDMIVRANHLANTVYENNANWKPARDAGASLGNSVGRATLDAFIKDYQALLKQGVNLDPKTPEQKQEYLKAIANLTSKGQSQLEKLRISKEDAEEIENFLKDPAIVKLNPALKILMESIAPVLKVKLDMQEAIRKIDSLLRNK